MKKQLTAAGALLAFFVSFVPFSAHAETVLRVSDSVAVAVDQVVSGDFYGVSGPGPVSLSGTIQGDALVIGSSITGNGTIEQDLFAVGGTVQMHASVTDDVRIIGGDVTIAEHVGGDLFVLGGKLTVLSSANISGNVFFYGGEAEINGRVGGSVFGTAEQFRIDGAVAEGVDVKAARAVVLGDRADIGGDIRYESVNDIVRAQNAVVVGDVVKNTPKMAQEPNPRDALVPFLIYAFSALIAFVLFRKRLELLGQHSIDSFTKNGLIGVAGMLLLPVVVGLLFVTVIGAVVGILGLFALIILYILSFVLTSVLIGLLLEKALKKRTDLDLLWTVIGIVAVQILLFIPVIGPLLLLVAMAVVFGTILRSLYEFLF